MQHLRPEGRGAPGHRGRLPGPRAVRQPRRRPEHVPGPRDAVDVPPPRRGEDGAARRARAQGAVGHDDPVGPPDRRGALRRPAPVGRRRQGGAVELASSSSSTSRPPRWASPRPGRCSTSSAPRRAGPRRGAHLAQHERRLRGRRPHHGPAPRPERRASSRPRRRRSARSSRRSPPASCTSVPGMQRGGDPVSAVAEHAREPRPASAEQSLGDSARGWWTGVRNGELGSLPIVVGIIVIAIYFQSRNSHFLTAGNFVNLIAQASAGDRDRHGRRVRPAARRDRPVDRLRERHGRRDRRGAAAPGRQPVADRRRAIAARWRAGVGDRPAPGAVLREDRRAELRGHARRPARLERRRAADHRQQGHDRHPGQGHQRPGQRLHEPTRWRSSLRGRRSPPTSPSRR